MSEKVTAMIEEIKGLTVLELSELVHALEEEFGVSAAAPVAAVSGGATSAEIESIVDAALDAKLSPIKRMLAEQTEAGPNLRDIIGGIGWIFGLIGVAAYFRRRL